MTERNKPDTGEALLYQTEDGHTRIEYRLENATLWLCQARQVTREIEHYNLKQRGRWAFAKFTEVYQIEVEFVKKVKAEFNKIIERLAHEN